MLRWVMQQCVRQLAFKRKGLPPSCFHGGRVGRVEVC